MKKSVRFIKVPRLSTGPWLQLFIGRMELPTLWKNHIYFEDKQKPRYSLLISNRQRILHSRWQVLPTQQATGTSKKIWYQRSIQGLTFQFHCKWSLQCYLSSIERKAWKIHTLFIYPLSTCLSSANKTASFQIAQLVNHCTGIAEVTFWVLFRPTLSKPFSCNCLSSTNNHEDQLHWNNCYNMQFKYMNFIYQSFYRN